MELFASGDYALFQWFNRGVVNPVFDVLMPILSGNPLFKPGLAVLAIALFWTGGRRGFFCALMLAATLAVVAVLASSSWNRSAKRRMAA
jgi:hypothetical protein